MSLQERILLSKNKEKIVKLENWSLKLNELGIPKPVQRRC